MRAALVLLGSVPDRTPTWFLTAVWAGGVEFGTKISPHRHTGTSARVSAIVCDYLFVDLVARSYLLHRSRWGD